MSAGDSNIGTDNYALVTESDWNTKITSDTSEAGKYAKTFFMQNGAEFKSLVVLEVGSAGDIPTKLKKVEKFIDDGKYPCWIFHLPSNMLNDAYLGTMLTKYSTETSQTYFSMVLDDMPASSAYFNTYAKGKKSAFVCYPTNTDSNLNIAGAFGGIIASDRFDISSNNTMRPLGGLKTPITNNVLAQSDINTLTEAFINFAGELSGVQVVLNGLFNDGEYFEKWYAFDTLCNKLISEMNAFYVNSVNLSNSALKYNNVGVKTARDKIISIMEVAQQLGLVNEFGSNLNLATGKIENKGTIGMIDAEAFKIANPTEAKAGIYSGFSCYADIQGFIKQIPLGLSF